MSAVEAAAGKAQAMVRDSVKTVIAASMVGTAIEFYDFYAYGTAAANYFPKVFFGDTTNPTVALLASLLTFAIAFIARPLGSLVFGHFGDRMGRKTTLVVSLLTMGIATFLIGCLPTYSQWGIVAVAALCLCRFVQGIGLGGEWSGAALVATENAPEDKRALYGSFPELGAPIGFFLSNGTYFLLETFNDDDAMLAWGWRVPFFIGVLLAPIGCWLHLSLENDVPEPVRNKKAATSESAFSLLLQHKATIVNGVLLAIGSTVATYISLFYYGTWAAKYLAMPQHYSHAAMLLAGVITFVGALLVGMLCDSVGRKKLILISRVMVLLCSWPSFWLLVNYPSPGMLLTVVFVMVSFTTLGGVPVMLLISELLPKRIRALGFALVYSIGVAIFGGFAQYFATQSIVLLDSLTAPAWYLGGGTLLSMLALLYVKEPAKELQ